MTDNRRSFDDWHPNRPWTVCFYSYRGGVGRTTLAVSTAFNIADSSTKNTTNSFLLDLDLEAPGIDEFEKCAPPAPDQKGLMEYVSDYRKSGGYAPNIDEYAYRKLAKSTQRYRLDLSDIGTSSGAELKISKQKRIETAYLHVMRAGRRDIAYRKSLAQLDWSHFCGQEEGYLFFENLRAGVFKQFGCEFMIVDARTGLSHISAVCIGHLADAVVLVFQPTKAHVHGLAIVAEAIRAREKREKRPIPRLYVASKMPLRYEDEVDPGASRLIDETIAECEGPQAELRWAPDTWEDELFKLHDPFAPTVHTVPHRERVESPHLPDSYLVQCGRYTVAPTALERAYYFPVEWIKESRCAVERWMANR